MAGADTQTICEASWWTNTCTFAKFYHLDAIANSDAEFARRVLALAGPMPWPHTAGVGITYMFPRSTTSIGRVELECQSRLFHSGSDTWGNNSIGLHTWACNHDYEMKYLFSSTIWVSSLQLLSLLDWTLGGGSLRSDL